MVVKGAAPAPGTLPVVAVFVDVVPATVEGLTVALPLVPTLQAGDPVVAEVGAGGLVFGDAAVDVIGDPLVVVAVGIAGAVGGGGDWELLATVVVDGAPVELDDEGDRVGALEAGAGAGADVGCAEAGLGLGAALLVVIDDWAGAGAEEVGCAGAGAGAEEVDCVGAEVGFGAGAEVA